MAEREVAMISGRQVPGAEKWRSEPNLTEEMMDVLCEQDHTLLRWWDVPDVKTPFVTRGGGAAVGLSETEHVHWGLSVDHPLQRGEASLDADLVEALDFECGNSPGVFMSTGTGRLMSCFGKWRTCIQRGCHGWTRCTTI